MNLGGLDSRKASRSNGAGCPYVPCVRALSAGIQTGAHLIFSEGLT